jgi:hypothetical protein
LIGAGFYTVSATDAQFVIMLNGTFSTSILLHGARGAVSHTSWHLAMIASSRVMIIPWLWKHARLIGTNLPVKDTGNKIVSIFTRYLTGSTTDTEFAVIVKT